MLSDSWVVDKQNTWICTSGPFILGGLNLWTQPIISNFELLQLNNSAYIRY